MRGTPPKATPRLRRTPRGSSRKRARVPTPAAPGRAARLSQGATVFATASSGGFRRTRLPGGV